VDLAENFPEESRLVIELLAKVYGQEKIVKDQNLTPAERLVHHQRESAPLMQELKNWCDGQIANKIVEPNSSLGKAIKYMQKHWDKLTRFLTAPGAPLDNNLCYAASGITEVMPTAGLCRIARFLWYYSCFEVAADAA
jgi:hypothetical protein